MSTVYSWRPSEQLAPSALSICCPRCEYSLSLHQPDSDLPDRLLATCGDCRSWFLTDSDGLVLIPLPELPNDGGSSETDALFPRIGP